MDIDRYKTLLATVASELHALGDLNGSELFLRWVRAADALEGDSQPNFSLEAQVVQVRRSAGVVVILASERYLGSTALNGPKQAALIFKGDQLVSEAARISREA